MLTSKRKILLFAYSILFSIATLSAQQTETHKNDISPTEENDSDVIISDHVVIHESENSDSRSVQCSCWIEPDDTYTLFTNANMDDGSTGNLALPFSVELFGQSYDSFWLNINGHVTFDAVPSGFFVDTDFPDGRVMLSPCHADIDLSCATCGEIYYKITDDAVYVNWVDVGHFNATSDQVQRFQLIFTSSTSNLLGDSNNVQFCYQDMQWTITDSSGSVELGASGGNATDNIEFGFFTLENSNVYDGPFGNNDGIDWLDNKAITFNSALVSSDNTPPISVGSIECDTIRLCQDDSEEINFEFLAPELNQNVTVTIDDGGFPNILTSVEEGAYASANIIVSSEGVTPGVYEISVTASDNGTPQESTTSNFTVEVIEEAIPDLDIFLEDEIVSSVSFCAGQEPPFLSGSDGFDCYLWSNGSELQTDQFGQGTYNLTAFFMGCEAEAGPVSVFQIPTFNPEVEITDQFLCDGETTELILQDPDQYTNPEWSVIQNNGEILTPDLTNDSVTVTPGTYEIAVIDENGCPGIRQIVVLEEIVNIPPLNFAPLCDETSTCWDGGWTDPETCAHFIYMTDSEGDTWEGAYIEVFIDQTGPFIFTIDGFNTFVATGVEPYHGQIITYEFFPGLDDDDIGFQLFDGDGTVVYDTAVDGLEEGVFFSQQAECGTNEIPGTWSSSCAEGSFDNPNTFNACYNVPDGFIGECNLTFDSDVCQQEISFTLVFSTLPTVEALDYLNQCGEVVIEPIYSSPLPPDATFNWTPNLNDGFPTATVTQSLSYTIEVETESCGDSEDTGIVRVLPIPNPVLIDMSICDGTSVELNPEVESGIDLVWSGPNVDGSTTSQITVTEQGTYTVTGSNDCGTESATSTVTLSPTPSLDQFPFDALVCVGDDILLDPNWNADGLITWTLEYTDTLGINYSETLSETSETLLFNQSSIPEEAMDNNVTVITSYTNDCGTATSQIVIGSDLCFITAPNVITPDSDGEQTGTYVGGLNEGWKILGIDGVAGVDVKIYDRWGALVYEDTNYENSNPWRGQHSNGSDLAEGVYFYVIKSPRGNRELNGSVTILRK